MAKLLALALLCCATVASAQTADWESRLSSLVAAARQEGKVMVFGPPDPHVRQQLPAAFKARFGVTVEYLGGRSNEAAVKLRSERAAGVYTADILFGGSDTMATVYYAEKMLAPLKPELFLPEAIDPTKWRGGKLWFTDPEENYVLRLFNTVGPAFHINTRLVNFEELTSARDLLNPKWRGKISAHDPTVGGSGIGQATRFYLQFGEAFVKQLYIDQKIAIARDRRQLTDWLVHGAYPISLDAEDDQLERFRKEGLPVKPIYRLTDMPATLSAGVGQVALVDRAPHPNAAKLFANWMASKEGLEIYVRARGEAPTRNDIDALSFLQPELIPQDGQSYFDMHDWNTAVIARQKVRTLMQDLLRARRND
jgi:iron(III) transport system substrate-binding protein